jgi:hypothetical protein
MTKTIFKLGLIKDNFLNLIFADQQLLLFSYVRYLLASEVGILITQLSLGVLRVPVLDSVLLEVSGQGERLLAFLEIALESRRNCLLVALLVLL